MWRHQCRRDQEVSDRELRISFKPRPTRRGFFVGDRLAALAGARGWRGGGSETLTYLFARGSSVRRLDGLGGGGDAGDNEGEARYEKDGAEMDRVVTAHLWAEPRAGPVRRFPRPAT